jgi:F-type H+-transporting ATPase subunit beta
MTEPPGARARVAISALTAAEYYRDEQGQDVLLFIDNIFRFTQAGSEVSALLGRMPSAVGYQPTLGTDLGELQERITSTTKGSITSVQCVYVPADDLTDPAPATTFRPLGRNRGAQPPDRGAGHLSRGGPPGQHQPHPGPQLPGGGALQHQPPGADDPAEIQGPAGHHRHPGYGRAFGRGQAHRGRARRIQRFLSQPFHVAETFTGTPGKYVKLEDTVRGFKEIVDGKHDEQAFCPSRPSNFYMVGRWADDRAVTASETGEPI